VRTLVRFSLTILVATTSILALIATPPWSTAPEARADSPSSALQACAPGVQLLGFSDALDKTTFGEFDVAELSGTAFDPATNQYYAVADRAGPVHSHVFTLNIPFVGETLGIPTVTGVRVLLDAEGRPFDGTNFDGEGIAVRGGDELIVASEGGSAAGEQPEIVRFSVQGEHTGDVATPPRFLIGTNNLSFESLALSPTGRNLFTAMEAPLPDDGRTPDLRSRIRIVRYEDRGAAGFEWASEYFYLTEPGRTATELGVAEVVALSDEELLVLERGFVEEQGNTIRVFRVSLRGATDVSSEPTLDAPGLAALDKTLVVDLANCPAAGATSPQAQPNPLLDNFEAMTLGPLLPGGRQALLLVSDDNDSASQVTRVVALAIQRDVAGGKR
jgi:hypothetical protein